jgi:hypothetical protein
MKLTKSEQVVLIVHVLSGPQQREFEMFATVRTQLPWLIGVSLPWPVLALGTLLGAVSSGMLIGGSVFFIESAITAPGRASAALLPNQSLFVARMPAAGSS